MLTRAKLRHIVAKRERAVNSKRTAVEQAMCFTVLAGVLSFSEFGDVDEFSVDESTGIVVRIRKLFLTRLYGNGNITSELLTGKTRGNSNRFVLCRSYRRYLHRVYLPEVTKKAKHYIKVGRHRSV